MFCYQRYTERPSNFATRRVPHFSRFLREVG